jgi:hypothetical protein
MTMICDIPYHKLNFKNNYIYKNLSPKRKNKITIVDIYEFLVNNNYNIKKFNFTLENQELYFVNIIDNSAVIKICCNIQYHLTIPLINCNYEYSTKFNNIEKLFEYLKYHTYHFNNNNKK